MLTSRNAAMKTLPMWRMGRCALSLSSEVGIRFLIARVRTFSACAYTAVCVFAHRPSTPKPYICYVRSCSVSVSVVFCRVS